LYFWGNIEKSADESERKSLPDTFKVFAIHMIQTYALLRRYNSQWQTCSLLMVSEIAPHMSGAEVPIAGAHLSQGQGAGADRQTS
jgi:hypothetical protein